MITDPVYDYDPYWRQHFRFSRETFEFIVQLVRASMEKRNTRFRAAIPIEKRIAVALWWLASGNSFRTAASTFGIGKSTAIQITHEFDDSLCELYGDWIVFPESEQDTAQAIKSFSEETTIPVPQILAAVDGCHIPIKAPCRNKESYFNRKHFYSMNLQDIVGGDGCLLDVAVGFPGSIHDARVLRMSGFFGQVQRNEILQRPIRNIGRVQVGPIIVGDSAYPGLPWLIKPYQNIPNLEQSKVRFNTILSKATVVADQAFGILKGRWRCLRKELEIHTENVPRTVVACRILYNICIKRGEPDPDLDGDDDDDDQGPPPAGTNNNLTVNAMRDAIRLFVCP